jgi:hypothetical protein
MPPVPDGLDDLPAILPWWGPRPRRARPTASPNDGRGSRYHHLIMQDAQPVLRNV